MQQISETVMPLNQHVAVIGGGPAGLMAAEVLAKSGHAVTVYEAKPSVARKFLRAGIGGLNITHSENYELFCTRYGNRQKVLQTLLDGFPPAALREWAESLGIKTFEGSSGKVFPEGMKAAPLLRAWVQRLRGLGVRFLVRHRWLGWGDNGSLLFSTAAGKVQVQPGATVLALGGGSWSQLGSDGAWVSVLHDRGVAIESLQSANCGFDVSWSSYLIDRHAGSHLKSVALRFTDVHGNKEQRRGELVISRYGVEGSLIYGFAQRLRDMIHAKGNATFTLDLTPDRTEDLVLKALQHPRGRRSLSGHLKGRLGISDVKTALLWEVLDKGDRTDLLRLACTLKALPITVTAARPLAEAISTAGGVRFDQVDARLMLNAMPGVFVAGEILDWEAPTGGYLLTACLAQGVWVGQGVRDWLHAGG